MPGGYGSSTQSLPQLIMREQSSGFAARAPQANGGPVPSPSGPQPNNIPPYGRPFSPPTEIRPLREDRPMTPGSGYPQQAYHVQHFPNIASGAPPPAAAMVAAEAAARDRDERPPSAMKRSREWEADGRSKKVASEENRTRLDEFPSRRTSPPERMASNDHYRRSSSERRENERRVNENYHPSEAAHHPYTALAQIPSMQNILEAPKEDHKEPVENAARKMEVDEDYDNSEDDKRGLGTRSSPQHAPQAALPKQEVAV